MAIFKVMSRETIASVSSPTGLTLSKLPPTLDVTYASIQAIAAAVRYTIDGSVPSTSLGKRLTKDSTVEIWGSAALAAFSAIDDGSTAKLEVIFYGGQGG